MQFDWYCNDLDYLYKHMKKLLLTLISAISFLGVVRAQQDPQFSQFFINRLNYNPGVAGTEEKICALGVYRSQWVGFGSQKAGLSPTTFLASINGPVGNNLGLGLNIYSDQLGFEKSIAPTLSVSYRFHFSNGGVLSPGLALGFMQKTIAGDKFIPLDKTDPKIPNIPVSGQTMDIGGGLYYTQPAISIFDNFYAGVSAMHLNKGLIAYEWTGNKYEYNLALHYFVIMGAQYRISNTLSVDPNLFVKTDVTKTSVDLNAMLVYNEKFKGGLTYRTSNEMAILVGFRFSEDMQLGYSYDLNMSNLSSYNNGSHELLFKYCFMPKFKQKPPKEPIPRLTPRFL